ncbi:helix-turn-helix domain-containing protein [Prauserella oleivorans]|uniref:Helix-turn-helix domain-containing protein n=1 Tax=Prauserella oleivorans TaxID=1478153 RepID=A0ABW5W8Y1_9PSEU
MIDDDARALPAEALERLRRRAVAAVESGIPQLHVARMFGVSRKTVGTWVRAYRDHGEQALRPRRRGRKPGEQLALSPSQQAWTVKTVVGSPPDEVGLPYQLWSRRALADLVSREFGITLSTATVGQYLSRWGLVTDVNLLARMRESSVPTAPRSPAQDAGRIRSDVVWTGWTCPRSPVEADRLNTLLAVTSRGVLLFLVSPRPFGTEQLGDFRERLRMQLSRDVRLVICSWPLEQFELLSRWLDDRPDVVVRVGRQ